MAPSAGRQLRISFRQYDGEMLGTCWCGRTWSSSSPREMWDWLDDHEHRAGGDNDPVAPDAEDGRAP